MGIFSPQDIRKALIFKLKQKTFIQKNEVRRNFVNKMFQ